MKQQKKKNITLDDLALMMGKGFNAVDKKFDGVYKRFDEMDEKFDEVDEKFDGVYKRFDEMDEKIDNVRTELKHDFNILQTAVDGYAKKADTYFQEMVMMAHKVDRMERWILQLAEKAGVQLKA